MSLPTLLRPPSLFSLFSLSLSLSCLITAHSPQSLFSLSLSLSLFSLSLSLVLSLPILLSPSSLSLSSLSLSLVLTLPILLRPSSLLCSLSLSLSLSLTHSLSCSGDEPGGVEAQSEHTARSLVILYVRHLRGRHVSVHCKLDMGNSMGQIGVRSGLKLN